MKAIIMWAGALLAIVSQAGSVALAEDAKVVANRRFVEAIAAELQTPPFLFSVADDRPLLPDKLPLFDEPLLKQYPASSADSSRARPVLDRTRVLLWALSSKPPPAALANDVKARQMFQSANLAGLPAQWLRPVNLNQFNREVLEAPAQVALVLPQLEEALQELRELTRDADKEPRRWQANQAYLQAHLMLVIAHLYEYQSALGILRRDPPELDPKKDRGWRLAPSPRVIGDVEGKKLAREANRLLESLAADHRGTPWELLANRLKELPVGVEWRPFQ